MENEQCGLCWNLKFDKQGNKTHGLLHPHDFVPFDYCIKCRKPKYDQHGFKTHPSLHDFLWTQQETLPHKFNSAIEAKTKAKRRKQRTILAFIGIASIGVMAIANLLNLIF